MTIEKFESIIGQHCSPVLMGIKPSNLVSIAREEAGNLSELLGMNAEQFRKDGILIMILCSCKKHFQVFLYRPDYLESYLATPKAISILTKDGYPKDSTLNEKLTILRSRMECGAQFPHEIGLFLGYPPEDVEGFRNNNGSGCKICGLWKVYGDVEKAKRLFSLYRGCRNMVFSQLSEGLSLRQIVAGRRDSITRLYKMNCQAAS